MKLGELQAAIGAAALLLLSPCGAKHGHSHKLQHLEAFGKRHNHQDKHEHRRTFSAREDVEDDLSKRTGSCDFPTGVGLVPVTLDEENAGWAMSPNQPCLPNNYCPYACPPGQLMSQWNPLATSYVYPLSMDGGLFCNALGQITKPFPLEPYCVEGTNTVGAQNLCGSTVSFCQTVLPGNEAMLIPTEVDSWAQLAVPGITYWVETAAHYYINPPGISTADGCVWSDGSQAVGNWAPYVAGANTDANGITYAKVAWNPEFTNSPLSGTSPTFGVKIECSGSGCNGLPCSIDPSVDGVGGVTSPDGASGAGGANFCVVTIPAGLTANVVVFPVGDSSAGSGSPSPSDSESGTSAAATPASTAAQSPTTPTTGSTPTTTSGASSTTVTTTASTTGLPTTSINTSDPSSMASDLPHVLFQQNSTSSVVGIATSTGAGTNSANSTTGPKASQTTGAAKNSAQATFVWGSAVYVTGAIAAVIALL